MKTKLSKQSNQPKKSIPAVKLKDIKPRKNPSGGAAVRNTTGGTFTLTFNGQTT